MPEPSALRQANLAVAWLASGKLLDRLSTTLTLLCLALALWQKNELPIHAGLLIATILGIIEKYYAIRVGFDRRIFTDWVKQWTDSRGPAAEQTMREFDEVMMKIGLRCRPTGPQRSLEERIAGSLGLLRKQAFCLSLQCASLVGAMLARFALP